MSPAGAGAKRVTRRRGAALVALAGLASGCLTPTETVPPQGQLRARAAFDSGAEPSVLGVPVDSVRAVVSRTDGEVVSDRVRPDPGQGGELSWLLDLADSEETFRVELELRSGGVVMYSGEDDARVTEGALGQAGVHDIFVRYVGPTPRVTRVEVVPDRMVFGAIGAYGRLSANAFDTNGDPVPRAVSWTAVDVAVATVDSDGVVTATGEGSTLVVAEIDGVADTAQIVVDPTLPTTTTITADSASIVADGVSSTTILVEVRDASGSLVGTSAGTVVLRTTLGTLGAVSDHGDGTYTATLTSETTPGTAVVSGTLAGAPVADTAEVELRPGAADPTTTTITADSASIVADGVSATTILVQVRDASGSLVGTSAGTVVLQTTLGTLGPVSDHGDGTYTATLTSETTPGTAVVSGTLAGAPVADTAEVELRPGAADPTTTTITADSASIVADGVSATAILVEVRDASGNLVGTSAGAVLLQTTLGTLGSVRDHGDGTYTATLTSETTVGTAVVSGTLAGAPVADTAEVELRPGAADPTTTTITADSASIVADGVSATTILVEVRDASGNLVGTSAGPVVLQTTLGTLGPVSDHGDGTYTATLTSASGGAAPTAGASGVLAVAPPIFHTATGTAEVTGTLAGIPIADTVEVEFRPGPADPTTTTITADSISIVADGVSATTILVEVRDAYGNLVGASAGAVVLQTTLGTLSAVTDHGDGTYTATLSSGESTGFARVTGTLAGVPISDEAVVEIRPLEEPG